MKPSDDKHYVSQHLPSRNERHKVKRGFNFHSGQPSPDEREKRKRLTSPKDEPRQGVRSTQESQPTDLTNRHGESSHSADRLRKEKQCPLKKSKKKSSIQQTEEAIPLWKQALDWVLTIALSFFLFWAITTYVAHTYRVSGSSMYPTLQDGERVIANKLEKVDRLDIVVLDAPDASGKEYVKRVIGMPGDQITYLNGQLFVNDHRVKEAFTNKAEKFVIDGKTTYGTPNFTLQQLTGEMVVPDGKYFVMGDNRGHSNDSRAFGFVDEDAVHGVVRSIYWPVNQWKWLKTPVTKP